MIHKYAEIFCWKNVSSFCSAKATHIFSAKNFKILCIESAKTVNEMTLNELVKLATLWTTGPWMLSVLEIFKKMLVFITSKQLEVWDTYLIWCILQSSPVVKKKKKKKEKKHAFTACIKLCPIITFSDWNFKIFMVMLSCNDACIWPWKTYWLILCLHFI